ncbi:MAG: hypothetical protein H7338_10935 [Candidatus Sericytochromatia bacterium]|nr:hypothetical protein [Candidatus Sericytochromatia bacterium]
MTGDRTDRPPVWAAAGIAAGLLVLVSPWLGGIAALLCLGGAVWQSRRPAPVPSVPSSGDLSVPWQEPGMDGLRQDLLALWERVHGSCTGLDTSMLRLGSRVDDWGRLLGSSAANVDTLARVTFAVRGDLDSAVRSLTREIQHLAGWQTAWEDARAGLQRAAGAQAAQYEDLQAWHAVWQTTEAHRHTVHQAGRAVVLPDAGQVPALLAEAQSLSTRIGAIAGEAGRLGKAGWSVSLAATEANDAIAAWSRRAETALPSWDAAARSVQILLAGVAAGPVLTVPTAAAAPTPLPAPAAWQLPDLAALIERLDRASHESELSAGLSEDVARQLVALQDNTGRLAKALADARHRASELLILSGYVRTRAAAPACHLNRTVWCITDGNCERCPLTKLDEADFPELLGTSADRPQPRVQRTGRTINLEL